jgi:hypothetical protein
MNDSLRLDLAKITAQYWIDTTENFAVQEFAKAFLGATEGKSHLTGVPPDELRQRMLDVRMDRKASRPLPARPRVLGPRR